MTARFRPGILIHGLTSGERDSLVMSDRRKMIEFISRHLPEGEGVLVLASGPSGPITAIVTACGDSLEIESNCPEWVSVHEVYEHLRWQAMPGWEQRAWLRAALLQNPSAPMDRAERVADRSASLVTGQRKLITARERHQDRFQGKISLRQVYDLFYSGDLEGFRVGRSVLLYDDSVDAYIRRNRNAEHPSEKHELEKPTGAPATIQKQRPRSSEQGGFQFFHLPEGR